MNKSRLVLWTIGALVVTILAGMAVEPLVNSFLSSSDSTLHTVDERYQNRFADIPGNFDKYIFWITLSWVVGGFTEEILFRGFLISRFERLFCKFPYAILIAILLQAFLFGQQHFYYQGITGWFANGAIGLISGVLYLVFKRNLWPLVFSHGLTNTLGLTMLYLS